MIYTFTCNNKIVSIYADSMKDSLNIMIEKHFIDFCDRKIDFIMSNDPKAPTGVHSVRACGIYGPTKLSPKKYSEKRPVGIVEGFFNFFNPNK